MLLGAPPPPPGPQTSVPELPEGGLLAVRPPWAQSPAPKPCVFMSQTGSHAGGAQRALPSSPAQADSRLDTDRAPEPPIPRPSSIQRPEQRVSPPLSLPLSSTVSPASCSFTPDPVLTRGLFAAPLTWPHIRHASHHSLWLHLLQAVFQTALSGASTHKAGPPHAPSFRRQQQTPLYAVLVMTAQNLPLPLQKENTTHV